MIDLVHCFPKLLFYDVLLLYYGININSLITFCLFSAHVYLSLSISIDFSSVFEEVSRLLCDVVNVILLPIKSPVASAAF